MNKGIQIRRSWAKVFSLALVFSLTTVATASDRQAIRAASGNSTATAERLQLDSPVYIKEARSAAQPYSLDPTLVRNTGRVAVSVKLKTRSTGELGTSNVAFRQKILNRILKEQDQFVARAQAAYPSITELARTQHVLNAIFLDVPDSVIPNIEKDKDVIAVTRIGHYRLDLSDTVPYVGAAAVQAAGFDGTGVRVAVLDSGVDYHHANLGGSGIVADYLANDPTIIEPGSFPTAKVTGGYDFVGNVWPNGPGGFDDPPMPDPDPLDDLAQVPGSSAGHGTHVADIIAGGNGVAPGAEIYAIKVCASLASSCNGLSLILGMEFAVDPDGDDDPTDAVDVINLSLGADYGQAFDDDLSAAVDNAAGLGVLTVSSAGNCGDLPYCTGSPSSASSALSVAQTQVPSALGYLMNVTEPLADAGVYGAVKYSWSGPLDSTLSGLVQYGDTGGSNLDGCAPFTGDFTGRVVAVDRGGCFFSDKVRNIENAGGILGIVMLVAPGAPFDGGFGGGTPVTIPGFNIDQAAGDILRGGNAVVEFGPQYSVPLVGYTVGSSARGPDVSYNGIKPEIGAPGGSLSAQVGTGTGETAFSGTSGASPMVAGAAALVQQACRDTSGGDCTPLEIKSLLMNNGYRDIISDTTGGLAEITRIGGGELRVDASVGATIIAYSTDDKRPSLGLGVLDVDKAMTIRRRVGVKNLTSETLLVDIAPSFRYGNDADTGAVTVTPDRSSIKLRADRTGYFYVDFNIDPEPLTGNAMNSGSDGNNPAALGANEYDGYLLLTASNGDEAALPWHVIPRKAANVAADRQTIIPGSFPDSIGLVNNGEGIAQNDAYSIVALSEESKRGGRGEQAPFPDLRAVGVTTVPVPAGFCSADDSFLWLFAINTWDRQSHLVPVSHQVSLDINRDGVDDYLVLNRDATLNNVTDGRQLAWSIDLASGSASAFFFADHSTNTNNTVLIVCAEQIGMTGKDLLATNVDVSVYAQDFYNGGPGDRVDGITITPLGERFFGSPSGDLTSGSAGTLEVYDYGAFPGNTPELGTLLFTNGDRGTGAHGAATEDTEALIFRALAPPS